MVSASSSSLVGLCWAVSLECNPGDPASGEHVFARGAWPCCELLGPAGVSELSDYPDFSPVQIARRRQ